MSETFRLHDEPLSFRDKAYIALCANLVKSHVEAKGQHSLTCDIMGAWDLAHAMDVYRAKMTKEDK